MKRICVITGTRAEYGLLYWLIKEISEDPEMELQLIATGMHLSSEFGLTYKEIEKDGFNIDKKIEILLSSDTAVGISKSMGLAQISFAETYEDLKPDLIIVLGDRFEIFAAAAAAMIAKIPIAHLYGGELTEGIIDEAIRHCITKMSHLHFTSTDEYRNRVIQLGEHPSRVFNVGDTSIDNIRNLKLLNREEFEHAIKFKLNKKNLIVTFHPVTLENSTSEIQFKELLNAIDSLTDTNIIFTKANADTEGRIINQLAEKYVSQNNHKSIIFTSMGRLKYLSALQFVDAVVGNSSSGIAEAPSFNIGTINIGDRQKGRLQAKSVINCIPTAREIKNSFSELYSSAFQSKFKNVENLYGDGNASKRIIDVIRHTNLNNLLKKHFYDLRQI
ncbi:MAG: UDP-N-acetylglucosamine 2-epimerase (hydrolyzing) [Desulfobacteraceae bacterium]|nr:UDP-N-acetylglucosamine 2-epimerase (hydrolyzing) [Desulfobacteraceae bacterium]